MKGIYTIGSECDASLYEIDASVQTRQCCKELSMLVLDSCIAVGLFSDAV